jgi:hypothetical protein
MGQPQALTIQLGQITSQGLQLPPGLDTIAYRVRQGRRDVIARGLALLAPEADVDVRSVLLAPFAAAVRLAAGTIGLGQRPEHRPLGQPLHFA